MGLKGGVFIDNKQNSYNFIQLNRIDVEVRFF